MLGSHWRVIPYCIVASRIAVAYAGLLDRYARISRCSVPLPAEKKRHVTPVLSNTPGSVVYASAFTGTHHTEAGHVRLLALTNAL